MAHEITRRGALAAVAGLTTLRPGGASAQALPMPAAPVALNIIDVAGNLQLTQAGIERFRQQNPKLISRITFSRAPSPELPAKLKAQQDAGRVDIDLVLTGPGALSDGIQSLYPEQFEELMAQVRQIAPVVGRTVPAIGTHSAAAKVIGVQAGVRPAAS